MAGFQVKSGLTYATWNPGDCDSKLTLSNNNLTVSVNTSGTGFTRATIGLTSGKWYWEVKSFVDAFNWVGISNGTPINNTLLGVGTTSVIYYGNTGQKYYNTAYAGYGATYTAGNTLGFALDMDAGTCVVYKDNVSQGTLISGLTGVWYPAHGQATDGTGKGGTANFGSSAFTYTPPAGFNAGVYV
jgi:hypothetical protein